MVDRACTSNIRRVYSRPWRNGSPANPGKVSTCVQVGMRPETTLIAHEAMLGTPSKLTAARAGLAGVGRIDELDRDSNGPMPARQPLLERRRLAEDGPAVLGTPDHRVGRLVETVAMSDDLNHASHGILDIYTGLARSRIAIPPATEVAGFLAENL